MSRKPAGERSEPAGSKVGGIDFGWRNPFAAIWGMLDHDDVLWILHERYLRETFGAEFDEYVAAVPRVVPSTVPNGTGVIHCRRWASAWVSLWAASFCCFYSARYSLASGGDVFSGAMVYQPRYTGALACLPIGPVFRYRELKPPMNISID